MSTTKVTRDYGIADAALKAKAELILDNVTRDMAHFSTLAVTAATLTAFEALITDFDDAITDVEALGKQMEATETKKAIAKTLKSHLKAVRQKAQEAYKKTAKYRAFGFKGMNKFTDSKLEKLGTRVVKLTTPLPAKLVAAGLSATNVTAIENTVADFNAAKRAQYQAIEERDIQTDDRILKGNAVNAELIRLCKKGQSLFEETNPALYNDYLIGEGHLPEPDTEPEPEAPGEPEL